MAISRAQLAKELEPGLNALFGMEYARYENEHAEIFETESSDRAFEEEVLIVGFGNADVKTEGQGVVYESMQMQDLQNYTVGGTIHVIVNNQIGFTTTPNKGRSAIYCSDLAKAINAPIFHVNADSMEDVDFVFQAAAEYR